MLDADMLETGAGAGWKVAFCVHYNKLEESSTLNVPKASTTMDQNKEDLPRSAGHRCLCE